LSRRAAQLLGVIRKGTAKVRVEALQAGKDVRYLAKAETAPEERSVAAAPQANVQSSTLAPPTTAKVSNGNPQTATLQPKPIENTVGTKQVPKTAGSEKVVQTPVASTEMYIQAGAFVDFNNANRLSARLSPLGAAKVYQVLVNGQDFYRVRLGPVYSVDEADQILAKLINSGHKNARIIIE
jgi:peptidoglycan lytic transglycosylase